ncbi:DUF3343 domain-containing protein [Geobacter sulfurreducens]|uniref:DUF3343 domain-containing protein n=1 Tax=Geobacter sulfurreducens TaxID=35554 RepID=UPI002D00BD14|nr:DUF3343 domain-containing protein [Geobacter sulfurreducens]HML77893.1 DUF3343 domain-containing protein [Geobacter sulfurreducens]
MVREGERVAIFNSIHRVMKAEKLLKGQGVVILLIPAPRDLHADCGLAIRYASADAVVVESSLREADLEPEEIHEKTAVGYSRLP